VCTQSFSIANWEVLLGPLLQFLSRIHIWHHVTVSGISEEPRWVKDSWEWQKGTSYYSQDTMKCYCCIYYLSCAEINGVNHVYFHKGHCSSSKKALFHQWNWILKKPTSLTGWWNPIYIFILSDPVHDIACTTKHQIKTIPKLLLVGLDWTQTTTC